MRDRAKVPIAGSNLHLQSFPWSCSNWSWAEIQCPPTAYSSSKHTHTHTHTPSRDSSKYWVGPKDPCPKVSKFWKIKKEGKKLHSFQIYFSIKFSSPSLLHLKCNVWGWRSKKPHFIIQIANCSTVDFSLPMLQKCFTDGLYWHQPFPSLFWSSF